MEAQRLTFDKIHETALHIMPEGSHVWLYGSRARGDAHAGSDWDILLLLDKEKEEPTDYSIYAFPFVELGWQNDAAVSPQMYTLQEWEARRITPYYQNVEHDKIVIL